MTIKRQLTDNGSCCKSKDFRDAAEGLGLKHPFTRPYRPQTNGKAERFIQTALREWAYAHRYESSQERAAHLPCWTHGYNWHRRHGSLDGKPLISVLELPEDNLMRLHIQPGRHADASGSGEAKRAMEADASRTGRLRVECRVERRVRGTRVRSARPPLPVSRSGQVRPDKHTPMSGPLMLTRNLLVLLGAQLCFTSGSVLLVTIGGIIGSAIAPSAALATLPVSLMVVGTAATTIPAALLMQRFGRRIGFAGAAALGMLAAWIGARALETDAFWGFALAAIGIGATLAFAQQFRFAAAEAVTAERAGQAISLILVGSIGGAFLGPELVARSAALDPARPFRFAMLALMGLYLVAGCLLASLRERPMTTVESDEGPARPLWDVVRQPLFVTAVLGGVIGQGVMTFLMTATPVSMHVVEGHGIAETAGVIRAHVIGMYAPSFVSALLIGRFGARRLMGVGILAMLATVLLGMSGREVMHYWFALVLLGIGWNFLFVGGTTLLVTTYRPAERFRAQAVNDFSVFGTSAVASLAAGSVMLQFGWGTVLLAALPPLALMAVVLVREARRARDPLPEPAGGA